VPDPFRRRALLTCPGAGDWSLPSNHATLAAALATAVVVVQPRLWAWAVPIAALVAASRVAAGSTSRTT
jgi:membrane-associated phospholipid phosphatase